jgi:hypothetical protein
MSFSGGCQCGAVRYRAAKAPAEPHLCHCRMCQKAAGNYFMPLGGVAHEDFEVTRGTISYFHSSDVVRRGFCALCGTPLTYETLGGDHVAITLGSLDRPQDVVPVAHSEATPACPGLTTCSPCRPSARRIRPTAAVRAIATSASAITSIRTATH